MIGIDVAKHTLSVCAWDQERECARWAEVASYADPEVQSFASLVKASGTAMRAGQNEAAIGLLSDAMKRSPKTFTGAWAALTLGSFYRDTLGDSLSAEAVFAQAAGSGGPAAQEALVAWAETVAWAGQDPPRALELAQQAVRAVSDPRFLRRALVVLGGALQDAGENRDALAVLGQVIAYWPDHPAAMLARITRSQSAYILGDLDLAAADGALYLGYHDRKQMNVNYVHFVLGNKAFRDGDYARAEAEFGTLVASPQNEEFLGPGFHGLAEALIAKGDLRGGLAAELQAADSPVRQSLKAQYLYAAALTATRLGDAATAAQVTARMVAECPGSHLTTILVGHDVLSATAE